jgi:molybdopterin-guanine dinucleotide biosynthesis protein A
MGGINKAFLKMNGERLIDMILKIFREIFDDIIVVAARPILYQSLNIMVVKDIIPEIGPLGGIYTALLYSSSEHIFLTACDMPFLNRNMVEYLIRDIKGYDVVVPKINGRFQPLHAVYSRRCVRYIKKLIDKRDFKIIDLFPKVKVKEIIDKEIGYIDKKFLSFYNINTAEDFKFALNIKKEEF